jgi:hypothetical protein
MIAMIPAAAVAALLAVVSPTPTPSSETGPTFCAEWIRQSTAGYDRLTLFRDGMLVWKTSQDGHDSVKRQPMAAAERKYYCDFFGRPEFRDLPSDMRTRLTADLASSSAVTLARADGSRKTVRFDEFSTGPAALSELRAALEGLKATFLSPLAPESRFAPDLLTPGTLLKRFDGAIFRVQRLERETGFVEIVGVTEPYSQFVKIEELRFRFQPPDAKP